MEDLWQIRHSNDKNLWVDLLKKSFPNIAFFLPNGDNFGYQDASDEITIASPFAVRDLLLALEKNQGYLFLPSTGSDSYNAYWFYLDTKGLPQVVTLYSEARSTAYFDENKTFLDAIEDLLRYDSIFVEEGALELIITLEQLGKEVDLLSDHNDGLYIELNEWFPDEDEDEVTKRELHLPPSFDEVRNGPQVQIWITGSRAYPEVALLKTNDRLCLITSVESGYDYSFEYTTSSSLKQLYPILVSLSDAP